jgi:hypothetical protein
MNQTTLQHMIKHIRDHGCDAYLSDDRRHLLVTSLVCDTGICTYQTQKIPATWPTVKAWLDY